MRERLGEVRDCKLLRGRTGGKNDWSVRLRVSAPSCHAHGRTQDLCGKQYVHRRLPSHSRTRGLHSNREWTTASLPRPLRQGRTQNTQKPMLLERKQQITVCLELCGRLGEDTQHAKSQPGQTQARYAGRKQYNGVTGTYLLRTRERVQHAKPALLGFPRGDCHRRRCCESTGFELRRTPKAKPQSVLSSAPS